MYFQYFLSYGFWEVFISKRFELPFIIMLDHQEKIKTKGIGCQNEGITV